jgi:hypothetical protein
MKITVPVIVGKLNDKNKPVLLKMLKQVNADEVFLVYVRGYATCSIEALKKDADFVRSHGYSLAVWTTTLSQTSLNKNKKYKNRVDIDGTERNAFCPFDKEFVADYVEMIQQIAKQGVDKIVLDDDFRMHIVSSKACCFCDEHLKFYSEYLKKPITRELMKEKLYSEGPNEYREAWLAGCKEALESMARAIRKGVDEIDEKVQIMLCAGPAHFGADGTSAYDIAEILRGKNGRKEFRLIGGPYWRGGLVSNALEAFDFSRQQAVDAKKKGYYTIGEGDSFPRSRYSVPSSELEFFHTLMIADGHYDRMMKYIFTYLSEFDLETGYAEYSEMNKKLYGKIAKLFAGKESTGFYVVEDFDAVNKIKKLYECPDLARIRSATRKFLIDLSLPLCHERGGVNVIFGENANAADLSLLANGNILDLPSALYLQERGVDVGIDSAKEVVPEIEEYNEYYIEQDDVSHVSDYLRKVYELSLKKGVKVLSTAKIGGKVQNEYKMSFVYENAEGQRFLVLNFDADAQMFSKGLWESYYRQEQVVSLVEWLNGKKLDAVCKGAPELYIMTKKNQNSLAVGLWNHFADPVFKPVVELGEKYSSVRFVNCKGKLLGDKVVLDKPIPPFSFCFMELVK